MLRLALVLFPFIATTLMGSGVAIVLTLNMVAPLPIVLSAGAGLLLSIPVCWLVARRILLAQEAGQPPQ